jgi:hypothetical protein
LGCDILYGSTGIVKQFFFTGLAIAALSSGLALMTGPARAESPLESLWAGFEKPPVDCRPHTRWWWMGNALTKDDIDWQLGQMQEQGMGGVEQVSMPEVYTRGNHDYLSPEYFELLRHAVERARERGLEVSLNFGGPGWIWGGKWVPKADQSKVMLASMLAVEGPLAFSGPLSEKATPNPNDLPRSTPFIGKEDRLLTVVAGQLEEGRLRADSMVDLTASVQDRNLTWQVPEGRWQVMAFWLTQRDNSNAVDHLNHGAMERYCEKLGNQYVAALGEHLGTTVESLFSDSFEVPIHRNGLYWTDGLFESFQQQKGYDLVPWLPALWWDVDGLSPRVRYDVNEFLHTQGMTAFFGPFLRWCEDHGVRGRIQPYGFVTDVIEGAGMAGLPEMEITPGEKDAVPWYDTRIGPREYVASGAHLYGRNVVTAEAFTFLHHEPYRETLEELKIATDGFLRAGANKIYNHGFIASPERGVIVPTRGFYEAIRISPENIWWPYYHLVAEYTARCCWMLRQGSYVADVAVYSPLANQWTQSVLNARKWTREFEWGGLNQLLSSNGYAFDLVNDDVLQNHMQTDGPNLRLGAMTYQVLILPDVTALPVQTLRQIADYVRQGGRVIALERVPSESTGLNQYAAQDEEVKTLVEELFGSPAIANDRAVRTCGAGNTWFMDTVLQRLDPLEFRSAAFDPLINALKKCVPPDMDPELVRAGKRTNDGLVCTHRHDPAMDIYFVTNLQDVAVDRRVGFHVAAGRPSFWDPRSGERRLVPMYDRDGEYTRVLLKLRPYESTFMIFEHGAEQTEQPHVVAGDFADIIKTSDMGFSALTTHNGNFAYEFFDGTKTYTGTAEANGIPAIFEVNGPWQLQFLRDDATDDVLQWPGLCSWTDVEEVRHFSGRARYTAEFSLPQEYCAEDLRLKLSLGSVGTVAEIRINGLPVGIHWMREQDFPAEKFLHPGKNTLVVEVTNTLINRVSGLDAFPGIAPDVQERLGEGVDKSGRVEKILLGFEPLPPSGLLGPVRIIPLKKVEVTEKP